MFKYPVSWPMQPETMKENNGKSAENNQQGRTPKSSIQEKKRTSKQPLRDAFATVVFY